MFGTRRIEPNFDLTAFGTVFGIDQERIVIEGHGFAYVDHFVVTTVFRLRFRSANVVVVASLAVDLVSNVVGIPFGLTVVALSADVEITELLEGDQLLVDLRQLRVQAVFWP